MEEMGSVCVILMAECGSLAVVGLVECCLLLPPGVVILAVESDKVFVDIVFLDLV